jgi:hypothetical protein
MAKIIRSEDIKRIVPAGQKAIATYSTEGVGAPYEAASNLLDEQVDRTTKAQLAKADADMAVALTAKTSEYEKDPDYKTVPDRFNGEIEERFGEIAASIQDAAKREDFINRYRPRIAIAGEKVKGFAWNKEAEFERGETLKRGESLRNAAVVDGDLAGARERYSAVIDSNVELGYIDADKAEKLKMDWINETAVAHIKSLDPEQRLEALKQPQVKDNLRPDVHAELLRKAGEDSREGISQDYAQSVVYDKGMTRAEANAAAYKKFKKDPKTLTAVEKEIAYEFAKRDKADVEARTELKDKWFDKIALGEMTVTDIKAAGEWDAMGANLQSTMISAQRASVTAVKRPFNIEHHDRLMMFKTAAKNGQKVKAESEDQSTDPGIRMREYFLKHAAELSPEQQKTWSTASIEGIMPDEVESGLTDVQSIAARLPETADASKRRKFLGEMGEWRKKYIKRFGKEPTDDDRDKYIDRSLLEYDAGIFYSQKPVREMDIEEKRIIMTDMRDRDPAAWKEVEKYFKELGYTPAPAEVMQKFTEYEGKVMPAQEVEPSSPVGVTEK